jgi:hypothetical protein
MLASRFRSFITLCTLFFTITFAFNMSFIANINLLFFSLTFQTFPKPPLPTTWDNSNYFLFTSFVDTFSISWRLSPNGFPFTFESNCWILIIYSWFYYYWWAYCNYWYLYNCASFYLLYSFYNYSFWSITTNLFFFLISKGYNYYFSFIYSFNFERLNIFSMCWLNYC